MHRNSLFFTKNRKNEQKCDKKKRYEVRKAHYTMIIYKNEKDLE